MRSGDKSVKFSVRRAQGFPGENAISEEKSNNIEMKLRSFVREMTIYAQTFRGSLNF